MPTSVLSPLVGGLGSFVREPLSTIRQRTGLLMGELIIGNVLTATNGSFTVDALKRFPNDAGRAVGGLAYIVAGTGIGQSRVVQGTTQASGAATVAPDWTTVPDSTSVIEIWVADRDPIDVNSAINLAIIDAQELVWVPDRANPISIDANYRELTMPTGFVAVYGFRYKDGQGNYRSYRSYEDPEDLPSGERSFSMNGTSMIIKPALSSSIALADQWVLGYRRPQLLVADTDISDVRTDFLVYKAATLLEESLAGSLSIDPEDRAGRGANWLREALDIRIRLATPLEPNTQEVKP